MVEFLQSILGTYSPVSYTDYKVIYETIDGSTSLIDSIEVEVIPNGLAGVDWLYVLSGLLFIVVIWSVFKLLGGLICKTL